jgi:hypothetical protein
MAEARKSLPAKAPTSSTSGARPRKVTGGYAGSALMRDLGHALS